MNFNIYDRLKDSSYSDGKFLSDKSYAYDTVYFISFYDYDLAYACMLLLNTPKVQDFLYSIFYI